MEIDNQHVRVGFSNPKLIHDQNVNVVHGHNDEDIPSPTDQLLINFHIVIDNFEWTVVRYYRDILRTINEIQKDCVELQQLSFLDNSLDEILNVVSLLKLTMFIPSSVKYLELFRRSIEDYFNLLFNLYYTLSNNSKQLFKDFLFDTKQRRELYNDYVSAHQIKKKKKGMNKIFHSVTKAFTGGHGNSHSNSNGNGYGNNENGEEQLELNKKNLSVVSKNVSKTKNGGNSIHGDIRPQSGNKSLSIFNFYKSKAKTIADNVTKKSSDEMNSQDNNQTDANTFRNANQLKVCVQRGQEMSHGVLEYEISLRVISSQNKTNNNDNTTDSRSGSRSNSQNGSKVNKKKSSLPIVYTTHQRYRKFKMLWIALEDMSKSRKAESSINSDIDKNSQSYANFMELMKNPFPSLPVRAYLGFSLTDSDLALRTRMLDAWFRELCFNYRYMPPLARAAIRVFLNFDMTRPLDIFVQDQLAWGVVEIPKTDGAVVIIQQKALKALPPEVVQRLRSGSNDTLTTFPGFGTTAGRQPSVGSEHRSNYTFTHSDTRSVSHHTPSSSRHLSKDLLSAEKDMLHDTIEEGSVNSTENRGSPGYNPLLREALLETQGKSFYNGNKPPPVYQIHS